jgi:hypothetical protein
MLIIADTNLTEKMYYVATAVYAADCLQSKNFSEIMDMNMMNSILVPSKNLLKAFWLV